MTAAVHSFGFSGSTSGRWPALVGHTLGELQGGSDDQQFSNPLAERG